MFTPAVHRFRKAEPLPVILIAVRNAFSGDYAPWNRHCDVQTISEVEAPVGFALGDTAPATL